ncbi:MAG: metallopeptidase family protein [Planctomycetes bacterium]|nr:metallopeptidase family protein [Planctomycetota bacterium]MBI3844621.1 metallopeptidase family protein [Planctomycetota bacterium]
MVSLPWKIFDKLMKDAYDSVLRTAPKEVAEHIRRANLEIVAEDSPADEVLEDMDVDDPTELMGLYESGSDGEEPLESDGPAFPDRVIVYRKSIEAACDSLAEAKREVLLTLIHEIAHHVGFEEDAMDRWEDEIAREREGEA